MKFFPLIWAMLWRSKARTWLTFLSIAVAFLLFGLLQSVASAFEAGIRLARDDQLIVTYRQGLTKLLPIAYRSRIERVEGVDVVDPFMFLGGWYQDPKNQVQALAIDPELFTVYDPRFVVSEGHLKSFRTVRMGALAGKDLAETYGWKVGDRISLRAQQKKDGSQDWEFEIVGFYEFDPGQMGQEVAATNLVVRYDYYNELTPWPDHVVWFTAKISDPKQASAIGKAIDRQFANSEFETRTQTQAEFQRGLIKQFGDVGLIMTAILAAVFFTLLLVAGNTMMQAFRDRIPELAVLKTLGFTNGAVARLVIAESLLLCVGAAAVGLGLAASLLPGMRKAMQQLAAGLAMQESTVAVAAVLAVGLGLAAALIPAVRSARLSVIDALAVR